MKKKIQNKEEALLYRKIETIINRFGRIRLIFPDYGISDSTWNGIYADMEMPLDYKKALFELSAYTYKLGEKNASKVKKPKKS